MKCPVCLGSGAVEYLFGNAPCSECGGSGIVHCCEGDQHQAYEPVIVLHPEHASILGLKEGDLYGGCRVVISKPIPVKQPEPIDDVTPGNNFRGEP